MDKHMKDLDSSKKDANFNNIWVNFKKSLTDTSQQFKKRRLDMKTEAVLEKIHEEHIPNAMEA